MRFGQWRGTNTACAVEDLELAKAEMLAERRCYSTRRGSAGEIGSALEQGLAEAVRFELTDGSPHRQFSRLLP